MRTNGRRNSLQITVSKNGYGAVLALAFFAVLIHVGTASAAKDRTGISDLSVLSASGPGSDHLREPMMEANAICRECLDTISSNNHLLFNRSSLHLEYMRLAWIFDKNLKDPRQEVKHTGVYKTIGRIESRLNESGRIKESIGTAFLVSPCHVLTNMHVVLPERDMQDDMAIEFHYGSGKNDYTSGWVVAGGDFFHSGKWASEDLVLVALDQCVGAPLSRKNLGGRGLGWMEIGREPNKDKPFKVAVAGYYWDRQSDHRKFDQLFVQENCEIKYGGMGEWNHDCAGARGGSGGPLFKMVNGTPTAYGMNQGVEQLKEGDGHGEGMKREFDRYSPNVAVDLSWILDLNNKNGRDIMEEINAALSAVGGPAANPQRQSAETQLTLVKRRELKQIH